jgi:hypothetical protein
MMPLVVAAMLFTPPQDPIRVPNAAGGEHAVYRTLQPGEQRNEGVLRRIVCGPRGTITLMVDEKEKVVRYTAAKLSAIDFIVYRPDFRGPVSCEGFGDGLPVYVTWKPQGKQRRAVAVEILPK